MSLKIVSTFFSFKQIKIAIEFFQKQKSIHFMPLSIFLISPWVLLKFWVSDKFHDIKIPLIEQFCVQIEVYLWFYDI